MFVAAAWREVYRQRCVCVHNLAVVSTQADTVLDRTNSTSRALRLGKTNDMATQLLARLAKLNFKNVRLWH